MTIPDTKTEIWGLSPLALEAFAEKIGEKAYRGRQIAEWFYKKRVTRFSEMTTLALDFRERLETLATATPLVPAREQVSQRDGTAKYLFRCEDGELVESVFLPHAGRNTACISTQVGCAMGCRFCATGDSGLARNLTAGEIVGQVTAIEAKTGQKIDNLVFMGMGEPLHNWPATEEALKTFCSPQGFAWGPRRLTVSTCGVASGIEAMAASEVRPRLAVSLHAGDDETRAKIMPINRKYPLKRLMQACRDYQTATGLQVTFEIALFKDVNDSEQDARRVLGLIQGLETKVNIIPYNPVEGLPFEPPDYNRVLEYQRILKDAGIVTMIRTQKGEDIDAACGQLRRREETGGKVA